ncbi:MAG: fused MFS/spermidine synthase, partial [Deltaproteobacteria bacterium]|nr:fused MFS/spermidine synthase [Deltaproteobacteria bacterium]
LISPNQLLYWLVLLTGVYVSIIPLMIKPVLSLSFKIFSDQELSIFFPSLLAIFVLFALPIFALGMVSPLAARIGIEKMDRVGGMIGDLYAFSTIGSLVGTFLPVLVLVPFIGSKLSFYLFGFLLILLGVLGLRRWYLLFLLLLPLLPNFPWFQETLSKSVLYRGESSYQYVQVKELSQGGRALFFNEGLGIQSFYSPKQYLTGLYWDVANLLPLLYPEGKNFLILGLAGGTSARSLHHFYPHLKLTGVEIDPEVIRLSRDYFGLDQVPIKIVNTDGRVFLNNSTEKYDFMMVDVFRDGIYVPFHMTTQEFFTSVKDSLTPKGVLMMNVFSPKREDPLLKLIQDTVSSVFPHFYTLRMSRGTYLFLASSSPLAFEIPESDQYPESIYQMAQQAFPKVKKVKADKQGSLSKDDYSLAELLSAKLLFLEKKVNAF